MRVSSWGHTRFVRGGEPFTLSFYQGGWTVSGVDQQVGDRGGPPNAAAVVEAADRCLALQQATRDREASYLAYLADLRRDLGSVEEA